MKTLPRKTVFLLSTLAIVSTLSCAVEGSGAALAKSKSHGKTRPKVQSVKSTAKSTVKPVSKPENKEVRGMLTFGASLHREGKLNEAEDTFRKVLVRDPQNADAFYNLGALAEGRGDIITALGHYRAAQALNPEDGQIKEAVISMENSLKNGHSKFGYEPGKVPAPAITLPVQANTNFGPVLEPQVTLPLPSSDPLPVQAGSTFQLTSNRNVATPPALGIQMPSQPPPPSVPIVQSSSPPPVRQPSMAGAAARSALGMAVNMGASYALRGTGLHCPVCRIVRLRF